jgi:hypothetical protein
VTAVEPGAGMAPASGLPAFGNVKVENSTLKGVA